MRALPILLFMLGWIHGGMVGDFVPLEIGNQWRYDGSRSHGGGLGGFHANKDTGRVVRYVAVDSSYLDEDTTYHVINVIDSITARYKVKATFAVIDSINTYLIDTAFPPDTVVEFRILVPQSGDSILRAETRDEMLSFLFFRHEFPDSMVEADTSDPVGRMMTGITSSYGSSRGAFLQDVGLKRYRYGYLSGEFYTYTSLSYDLTYFNGEAFSGSLSIAKRKSHRDGARGEVGRGFPFKDGRADVLGRMFRKPGSASAAAMTSGFRTAP